MSALISGKILFFFSSEGVCQLNFPLILIDAADHATPAARFLPEDVAHDLQQARLVRERRR